MDTLLEKLCKDLSARGVKVLLIGGHAMRAHGVVRQTLDVDLLAAEEQAQSLKSALREEGYAFAAETRSALRFQKPGENAPDIDVLLVDRATYDALDAAASTGDFATSPWRVPCPEHLIALKLHAMKNDPTREARDAADIVELIRATGDHVSREILRRLCEQYGPTGIYERIFGKTGSPTGS